MVTRLAKSNKINRQHLSTISICQQHSADCQYHLFGMHKGFLASLCVIYSQHMKQLKSGKMHWQRVVVFVLIFLFIYTGSGKLFNHYGFYWQLTLLPFISNYAYFISWFIPLIELFISLLLLFPSLRLLGFYCSLVLLILFSVYLTLMIYSGANLPCSCGGVIEYLSWKQHILFNLFFIILSAIAIKVERNKIRNKQPNYLPSVTAFNT